MKTKFKIIFSIIMLFTIMLLTSCKMNSAENGLDLYKENLSSLYEGKDINYDSCTYVYVRQSVKNDNETKEVRTYYYELNITVDEENINKYFIYHFQEKTVEDTTKETYQTYYQKVEDGKLDGRIVKLY